MLTRSRCMTPYSCDLKTWTFSESGAREASQTMSFTILGRHSPCVIGDILGAIQGLWKRKWNLLGVH